MNILATNAAGGGITLIWLVAMFGLLYFFVMRPQKKQMKLRNEMLANLSVGDHVVTAGGITGYIRALTDEYAYVEIAEGLTVELTRQAISTVLEKNGADTVVVDADEFETLEDNQAAETTEDEEK